MHSHAHTDRRTDTHTHTDTHTWLMRLSRGLPSDPTRQVSSCGIHANHWMGGTPMQYLSTASANVFLSSKLRSHRTWGELRSVGF